MSEIFTEILILFQKLFLDAPAFVLNEVCMWLAVAATLFVVAIPFVLIYKLIRLIMGVG